MRCLGIQVPECPHLCFVLALTQVLSSPVDRVWLAYGTHTCIPAGLQHRVREPHDRPTFREPSAAEVEPVGMGTRVRQEPPDHRKREIARNLFFS